MDNDVLVKILERLSSIETRLEALTNLKTDVSNHTLSINNLENKEAQLEKEVEEIKENTKWLKRLCISGFVTIGTGLLIALFKVLLGI